MKRLIAANARQVALYLAVGGATFLIYFGLLALLFRWMNVSGVMSVVIAYPTAVLFHFLANRKYTFTVTTGRIDVQVWRYIVLTAVNYLLQVLVVYLVHDLAGQSFYFGVFLGIALTLVVGFVGNRLWVFGGASPDVGLAGNDNNHVRPQECSLRAARCE